MLQLTYKTAFLRQNEPRPRLLPCPRMGGSAASIHLRCWRRLDWLLHWHDHPRGDKKKALKARQRAA